MSIYEKLFPWQKKVVDKFYEKSSFGLFLDMGLGKTPLSLAFAEKHECNKIIVITINSKALESKEVEGSFLFWSAQANIDYVAKQKWSTDFSNEPEIFLINYESLFRRLSKEEKKRNSGIKLKENVLNFINSCKNEKVAIIIDESHKVKDIQSSQSKSITLIQKLLKLKAKECYTYLLTGTPFTTGYIDLYAQLKLLGYNSTKGEFVDNYCIRGNVPGLLGWQQPIIGYRNVDDLYKLVHTYAITIESEDVMDLPPQIFVRHTLPQSTHFDFFVNDTMKKDRIYEYLKSRDISLSKEEIEFFRIEKNVNPFFRNIAFPDMKWLAETTGTFWLRARQLSIGFQGNSSESVWYDRRRLDSLRSFLQENEDNYLIFYNYTPELLELYNICEELKYNIDIYCGEMKSLYFYERYISQDKEKQLTNKKNVILANFASGSTGMNWQQYNKCIIFSTPLYKDYRQGIKRIHRTGQKDTVIYHVFSQNNWLDKNMQNALNSGIDYSSKLFEDDLARVHEIFSKDTLE